MLDGKRVWDCFIFFNELELLELRLNELEGIVDRHVICEATVTHAGDPKPLCYAEHADDPELHRFRSRIVHIVVDDVPMDVLSRWVRDLYQRDAVSRGWTDCAPDDLVLVSDADEIPRPSAIRLASQRLGPGFIRFHMKVFMAWINGYKNEGWPGTMAGRYKTWRKAKAGDSLRWKGPKRTIKGCGEVGHRDMPILEQAGWHFSALGGPERIIAKARAWEYPQYEQPDILDPETITRRMATGEDVFGRGFKPLARVPIDERFPAYVQAHPERFKHLTWEA